MSAAALSLTLDPSDKCDLEYCLCDTRHCSHCLRHQCSLSGDVGAYYSHLRTLGSCLKDPPRERIARGAPSVRVPTFDLLPSLASVCCWHPSCARSLQVGGDGVLAQTQLSVGRAAAG